MPLQAPQRLGTQASVLVTETEDEELQNGSFTGLRRSAGPAAANGSSAATATAAAASTAQGSSAGRQEGLEGLKSQPPYPRATQAPQPHQLRQVEQQAGLHLLAARGCQGADEGQPALQLLLGLALGRGAGCCCACARASTTGAGCCQLLSSVHYPSHRTAPCPTAPLHDLRQQLGAVGQHSRRLLAAAEHSSNVSKCLQGCLVGLTLLRQHQRPCQDSCAVQGWEA